MTPEAMIAALHLAAGWREMLRHLTGQPMPTLPDAPARRCRPLGEIPTDESDPHAERWDAQHSLATAADSEGGDVD